MTLRMELRLEGAEWKALARKMAALGPRVRSKVGRQALRAGAHVIRAEAQRRVPVDTGVLRKSIKVRSGRTRGRGELKMLITLGASNLYSGDQFYGAFVEFGHRRGKRGPGVQGLQRLLRGDNLSTAIDAAKRGVANPLGSASGRRKAAKRLEYLLKVKRGEISDSRKQVPARPFMRGAFDAKKDEASRVINETLAAGIEREWGSQ